MMQIHEFAPVQRWSKVVDFAIGIKFAHKFAPVSDGFFIPCESYYWEDKMKRTLEELIDFYTRKKDNYGCISPPLLNVKLENIRLDELHLLLRITGNIS